MWAYGCGVISSGVPLQQAWAAALLGALLAGPFVCAMSQAANDWFDRHVDAINEPHRPIPSGRVPGHWGLWIALAWSGLSLALASVLGPWVFGATVIAMALAWGYSAPPFRLKQSGIWGAAACGLAYEGIAWFTGAAAVLAALPSWPVIAAAGLYSLGAHGIMTLNDFKAVEGDQAMGIRSLPVRFGVRPAAWIACTVMVLPQLGVVGLLIWLDQGWFALGVAALVLCQIALMPRLLRDPKAHAPWFNATGTGLFVLGMLVSAFAIRGVA
ncbi:MAG: chlorophyll synthase ChlG [Pseudomonadota bacterium]